MSDNGDQMTALPTPQRPQNAVVEGPRPPKSLPALLADSFVYPVRGWGWALILGGTFAMSVPVFLEHFIRGLVFVGICRLLGMYIVAYFVRVLTDSAGGSDSPPDWPELHEPWDDIVCPCLLWMLTVAAAFTPLVAVNLVLYREAARLDVLNVLGSLLTGPSVQDAPAVLGLRVAALAVGLIPLPMALVSVALQDSPAGLNPLRTIPAIFRIGRPYALVLASLAGTYVGSYYLMGLIPHVAVLGSVLVTALGLYIGIVTARTLGSMYHRYAQRIGWCE